MAHFYDILRGKAKTQATRCGTRTAGLETIAASWSGAIKVRLFVQDGADWAEVRTIPHHGHGTDNLIYRGPVDPAAAEPAKAYARVNAPAKPGGAGDIFAAGLRSLPPGTVAQRDMGR